MNRFRIVACTLLCSALASAAPTSSDGASAQLFFERGRDAAAAGDAMGACRNFEESLRLEVAVGTLFNLAQCEEKLGRLASAWQHLREGADRLDPSDPRTGPARKAAEALAPRIPKLLVRVAAGTPESARVSRDGVPLTGLSLTEALPVNPGKHVVLVEDDGYAPGRFEVELAEGESKSLDVALGKRSEAPPPKGKGALQGVRQPSEASSLRTAGWVGVAVGGASLAAGLVTGGLAYGQSRIVKDHCDAANTCDSDGSVALASAQRFGTISTVTSLVGLGVLGAGIVLVLIAKPSVKDALLHLTEVRF